jgi:hypothetical protein
LNKLYWSKSDSSPHSSNRKSWTLPPTSGSDRLASRKRSAYPDCIKEMPIGWQTTLMFRFQVKMKAYRLPPTKLSSRSRWLVRAFYPDVGDEHRQE